MVDVHADRPMRVAQVNYAYDGALRDPEALLDRYTTLTGWSEAVAAGGARVRVFQRFSRNARLTRNGIDYVFVADSGAGRPGPWTWPRRLHRAAAAATAAPDIVHVNGLSFPVQTALMRRALAPQSAVVVQDHGSHEPATGGRAWTRAGRLMIQRLSRLAPADAFFFAAAGQERAWRVSGRIAPAQPVYHVMESSTTLRPIARDAARQASGVDGEPAVLWVGRLTANKDPLTVLDGFELGLAGAPSTSATLTMIHGADDLLPAVRARVEASPALRDRVRLRGRVPHHLMPAFYSAADMFVLGSHHEGSGYALLEACACGAVPVVTGIPSFFAITGQGAIGALWTPGDARSLGAALAAAARSDFRAARAAVAAHFERELAWPAIGRRALAAYCDVLDRRRAAGRARR